MESSILELVCDSTTRDLLENKAESDTYGLPQEFFVNPIGASPHRVSSTPA